MKNEDVFYDNDDAEILMFDNKDEFIEHEIEQVYEFDKLPKTLLVHKYQRRKVNHPIGNDVEWIMESLLERMDEEYGGEDPTEMTEEMRQACFAFVEKFQELYVPWQCDIKDKEEVDLVKWIAENRSDLVNEVTWME